MTECTALATKIDKSQKPEIVKAYSTLATIAVGTSYAPELTALRELIAKITPQLKALGAYVLNKVFRVLTLS